MSRYQKYQAYKDSGVEWIGEIPEHWEVKRLKFVSIVQPSNVDKKTNEGEFPVLLCNYSDVYNNYEIDSTLDFIQATATQEEIEKFHLSEGDVIVTKDSETPSDIAVPAYVKDNFNNVICGYHLTQIKPKEMFGKYLFRLFQSTQFNAQFIVRANGVTRFGLPQYVINNAFIIKPPFKEQQAIANFLDRITAQIDELIAKKEKLLKKLDEKRAALITQAVTKGIDPTAPMKESGVEWIGEIPEHWEVTRIKFIFPRLYSGVSVNSDAFPSDQDSIGVLKTSCVYGNRFSPVENKKVIDEETEQVACPVTKDSVIISRMNTPDLVGSCGYVEFDYPNLFLPDRLWIARFEKHKKMTGKYAWYIISSDTIIKLTGILATGTSGSMKNLSQDSFLNITTAVPPIDEQQAITQFLDKTTATIECQKAQVTEAIERLKEYRIAQITDAVTGKMTLL